MSNLYFSEYFLKPNYFHRLDARTKILCVFALLIMVLLSREILFHALVLLSCLIICTLIKIPYRILFLRILQPLTMALVLLLLKLFFYGKTKIFSFPVFGLEIIGYKEGLIEGGLLFMRILAGVSLVIVLGFTTPFTEFVSGLSWLKTPKAFVEIMLYAYRYIFLFLEEALTIYHAQKNRLGYVGIKRSLSSFGILSGSLILRCFDQSRKTAEAMMLRGHTGEIPDLENPPLTKKEMFSIIIFIAVWGSIWIKLT